MKKWLVVCAIVCGLTVQGCVLVFAPKGPFEPHDVPPPGEFEMREQELNQRQMELNEWAEHLDLWEQDLRERQGIYEEDFGEHEEEGPGNYEEEENVD